MKNTTIILVIIIFALLGIQFIFRATETLSYTKGEGAISPVNPQEYTPEKLYGNRSTPSSPEQSIPDSTQQAQPKTETTH